MKTKLLKFLAFLLLLIQFSCIERYWPNLDGAYQDALVIDGTITDKPGPYTVKLSRSSSVEFPKWLAYTGCNVSIICDDGNVENLTESEPGVY